MTERLASHACSLRSQRPITGPRTYSPDRETCWRRSIRWRRGTRTSARSKSGRLHHHKQRLSLVKKAEREKMRVSQRAAGPAAGGGLCGECGEELEAGTKFCAACGAATEQQQQ